jgi:hypothetical protein
MTHLLPLWSRSDRPEGVSGLNFRILPGLADVGGLLSTGGAPGTCRVRVKARDYSSDRPREGGFRGHRLFGASISCTSNLGSETATRKSGSMWASKSDPRLTLIPRGLPRALVLPPRKYYTEFVHYSLKPHLLSSLFRPDMWRGCSSNSRGSSATQVAPHGKIQRLGGCFSSSRRGASRYGHQAVVGYFKVAHYPPSSALDFTTCLC